MELLVSSRPPVPKGLLKHLFSYLNPLEYIPEKWKPTALQITGVFFLSLFAGQAAYGIYRQLEEVKSLDPMAARLQKEVFDAVPKEMVERIERESAAIHTLLSNACLTNEHLSEINTTSVTNRYPATLSTFREAKLKWGNLLTNKIAEEIANDHKIVRMIASSPISNPYVEKWQRITWPKEVKVEAPLLLTDEGTASKVNEKAVPTIKGIGEFGDNE